MYNPKFWNWMDEMLDGHNRLNTLTAWFLYVGLNMAIMAKYCYDITPQWH